MAKRKPSSKGRKQLPEASESSFGPDEMRITKELLLQLFQSGASPADIMNAMEAIKSAAPPGSIKALEDCMQTVLAEQLARGRDFLKANKQVKKQAEEVEEFDDDIESFWMGTDDDDDDDFDEFFDEPGPLTRAEAAEECAAIDKQLKRKPNDFDLLSDRAMFSPTADEAIVFQQRALEQAAKKLGKLDRYAGRFWTEWKTRPYMTARFTLARYLWEAGLNAESIEHLEALMAMNPLDHQGTRYRLLKLYLDVGRWDDAGQLIGRFSDEEMADIRFTAVLLEFRKNGDSENARTLLRQAMKANRYAANELLGEPPPDDEVKAEIEEFGESGMTIGGVSEAQDHAQGFRASWRTVPGAITWLRAAAHRTEAELKAEDPAFAIGDQDVQVTLKELRQLLRSVKKLPPDEGESWIVDVIPESNPGKWGLMVVNASDMEIISAGEVTVEPTAATVAANLCDLMLEDEQEFGPYRPLRILLVREEQLEPFKKWFEPIGIEVEMAEQAEMMRQMSDRTFSREELPDALLTDVPQYETEVWEVDWRRADTWVQADSGELVQPWVMMVLDRETELIIQNAMDMEEPSEETIDRNLRRAVLLPQVGDAHRPGKIVVKSGDSKVTLSKWLRDAEVECEIGEFEVLEDVFQKMKDDLFPDNRPALVDTEGASPELIGDLYAVSARYFKAAPWRTMRPSDIVAVSCPQLSHLTYYAAGMGQNGEGMGFMLFDAPDVIRSMFGAEQSDAEFGGLSLTLEDKHDMAPADIAAAEQFGWPVVSDESWPMLVNMNMATGMTPVSEDQIRIAIVAAEVMLEFWKSPTEARKRGNERLEVSLQIEGQPIVGIGQLYKI